MLTKAEARTRKSELDAAGSLTPDERQELVAARTSRDTARDAKEAADARWVVAIRSRRPAAEIEAAEAVRRDADEAFAAATRRVNTVESRIGAQRHGRRRRVKRAHQAIDDERTARRVALAGLVRHRFIDAR